MSFIRMYCIYYQLIIHVQYMCSLYNTFSGPDYCVLLNYYNYCFLLNMAESQPSLSSFKEQFDNQLTCNVCLDQYTDPKVLPCHHSFCLKCIQLTPTIIKVISLLQLVLITHLYIITILISHFLLGW